MGVTHTQNQLITSSYSTSVISNNLYDVFGVLRYEQGSAETPWRWKWIQSGEEGLRISPKGQFYLPERILVPLSSSSYDSRKDCPFGEGGPYPRSMCERFSKECSDWAKERFAACQSRGKALAWCGALGTVCFFLPVGPLKPLCGAAGGVCTIGWMTWELVNRCESEFTGRLSFCVECSIMCFRNSYPDKPDNGQNR